MSVRTFSLSVVSVLMLCAAAHAVTTRQFQLDAAATFAEGKLEGAAVLSSGAVVPSVGVKRVELPSAGVARALLPRPDGSILVGTGNQGKLFKVTGDSAAVFSQTGELLVSALAADDSGTVYAGTLPKGKIFAIDAAGKTTLFAQPEGVEHIWALVHDGRRHRLFAATGPHGKVFAIDTRPSPNGKREIQTYLSTNARHVMTLALDPGGALYAGTSDDALVWRIEAAGQASVVYDFDGNEITALSLRDGKLAVAANNFPKPPGPGDAGSKDGPKPGTGELWLLEANGEARKLFTSSEDGHLSAIQWSNDGAVYAATGKAGHIYRVQLDGTNALWIDVEERQVLALRMSDERAYFSTGDAGALYRVLPGTAGEALWTSKVLDAGFTARFGQLDWRGRGRLSFQTRSGNTEKPENGWSAWSSPLTRPGPIRSPGARFLQVRVKLDPKPDTILYAAQAYYLPGNQLATSKEITVRPLPPKGADDAPTAIYKIEWKLDNPDGDRVRYRLRFRSEPQPTWRPLQRESDVLLRAQYEWSTDNIPDGYYRIEVESSDELDNPAPLTRIQRSESEPFLVDNTPPKVVGLQVSNARVIGKAVDGFGPITRLEYSVDAQDWHPLPSSDGLLDSEEESFDATLPELAKGSGVIAVRARDARNNVGTTEVWLK